MLTSISTFHSTGTVTLRYVHVHVDVMNHVYPCTCVRYSPGIVDTDVIVSIHIGLWSRNMKGTMFMAYVDLQADVHVEHSCCIPIHRISLTL